MNTITKAVAACLILCSDGLVLRSQQIVADSSNEPAGDSGYNVKLDPIGHGLIAFRDVSSPSLPALKLYLANGKKVSLFPVRDLGATYIDIWDVASAPNNGTVIAGIMGYGSRQTRPIPVKSLILTYDADGTLRSAWDMEPYHHHHITVDSAGNVYALGHGDADGKPQPLLVKYSPAGEILGEYLPSNLFSEGDVVVGSVHGKGESSVFTKNDYVFVWIASTQELFAFSPTGNLESRISLGSALTTIAAQSGSARANVFEIRVDSAKRVVAQVQLWPKDGSTMRVGLARINADGAFDSWIERVAPGGVHRFLGLSPDDRPLFLERFGQKAATVSFDK
jgi:hypothetical protein